MTKQTEHEKERRSYLRLWKECIYYDPAWVHTAMEVRRTLLPQQDEPEPAQSEEEEGFRFQ